MADTECNAIGLREVNIRWKPITTFNSPTIYSVHFCKDLGTILYGEGNPVSQGYQFGCSRVVDRASLTGQYRQCDLGGPLQLQNVGEAFSYYIRANNSGKVYWSRRNTCRVTMKSELGFLTLSLLSSKVHSPNLLKRKCISEIVRIGSIIISLSSESATCMKSQVLHTVHNTSYCMLNLLARLQGKFDTLRSGRVSSYAFISWLLVHTKHPAVHPSIHLFII